MFLREISSGPFHNIVVPAVTPLVRLITTLLFVEGSAADVEAEANDPLEAFRERRGFILSSGCEIPPEAKPENVAMGPVDNAWCRSNLVR
jgi:hypothetical protein